ncbi:MAG: hypothetical protein NWS63_00985, partial [Saprospiraceae bacterium]|nr:hypothetical protein [Saprospiraceae bacterium]
MNFTLTNLARTVLAVLISFTVGLTGLQAQPSTSTTTFPSATPGLTAMECDSAHVTSVTLITKDPCSDQVVYVYGSTSQDSVKTPPDYGVEIEFTKGGTLNDPSAVSGHYWQVVAISKNDGAKRRQA